MERENIPRYQAAIRAAVSINNIYSTSDALEWIVKQQGVRYLYNYLDDYITLGEPNSTERQANSDKLLECCRTLGVPIAQEKCEGPTIFLMFLGIETDTQALELCLPADKLNMVQMTVKELAW